MALLNIDNLDNLVVGKKYRVTRTLLNKPEETFEGYFSSKNDVSIVFNVKGKGKLSFPLTWLKKVQVFVHPELSGDLNEHINSFGGRKRTRRKRKGSRKLK